MKRTLLLFALFLTLLTTPNAETYLRCDCSPTKRGFNDDALDLLVKHLAEVVKKGEEEAAKGSTPTQVDQFESSFASTSFRNCVENHSYEECVNADAALRRGPCYPSCRTYCTFYEPTWENLNDKGERAPACDRLAAFRSNDTKIVGRKAEKKSAVRPSPSPSRKPVVAPGAEEPEEPEGQGQGQEQEPEGGDTASPGGSITVVLPSPQPAEEAPAITPAAVNEGCVAVEHLKGYVLQHRRHLSRPVLCANGFCATPNHAIIVNGEWTSMKQLCSSKWDCVPSVKLVNNLKLSANRRAVINDVITVTPYDLRFPRWGVWLVQIGEDVLELVLGSAVIATLSVVVVVMIGLSKRV